MGTRNGTSSLDGPTARSRLLVNNKTIFEVVLEDEQCSIARRAIVVFSDDTRYSISVQESPYYIALAAGLKPLLKRLQEQGACPGG